MAYVDILSPDAYGRYNRKLARLTSIVVAVYWSEILDISTKVVKKQKFDSEGFFKLDRKYIQERTTICPEEQIASDMVLMNLGVLEVSELDPCMIRVKLETAISILVDDDFKIDRGAKKRVGVSKVQAAASKKAGIIYNMKQCISESDPDLRTKYESWIESVYAGKYFLTKALIKAFEDQVNAYTSDKSVKLALLEEAILTGYREFEWVKKRYETYKRSNPSQLSEQKISTGVKSDINF